MFAHSFEKCCTSYERKPIFENADGAFRVIMPNCHYGSESETHTAVTIPGTFDRITEYLHEHGSSSRKELEQYLGLGTTRTIMMLKEMLAEKMIVKNGNGKLTKYSLK